MMNTGEIVDTLREKVVNTALISVRKQEKQKKSYQAYEGKHATKVILKEKTVSK